MTVTVHVSDHALVADSLGVVRDVATPNAEFRRHLERIGTVLLVDASRRLPTEEVPITTPITTTVGRRVVDAPVIVPILRAGLGFVGAAEALMPESPIGFVGVARDETTFEPSAYVDKLPTDLAGRRVIVVDPMLATGGSLIHVLDLLVTGGVTGPIGVVCALAAPEGIARLEEHCAGTGIDVEVFTASIDERLNERAYIVPGLGDAGDRLFGTPRH
ncbi:MAG: uracil phosphoribosyltransferase [Ilumatobacteraceae bacterium]